MRSYKIRTCWRTPPGNWLLSCGRNSTSMISLKVSKDWSLPNKKKTPLVSSVQCSFILFYVMEKIKIISPTTSRSPQAKRGPTSMICKKLVMSSSINIINPLNPINYHLKNHPDPPHQMQKKFQSKPMGMRNFPHCPLSSQLHQIRTLIQRTMACAQWRQTTFFFRTHHNPIISILLIIKFKSWLISHKL